MDLELKDKVVVVTGSGRGIGAETAAAFAQEGSNLVINFSRTDALAEETLRRVKALGAEAMMVKADVSKSQDVKRLFAEVVERFGTVDVLVNNASRVLGGPTDSFSDKDWKIQIGTGLDSAFFCSREALKIMKGKRSGKIINISSIAGVGFFAEHAAYSAAKAGIIGLTRSLAKEFAPFNIQINAVAPGFIDSPLIADFVNSEQSKQLLASSVPAGRFGKMSEIAATVVFLASHWADYFTGEVLTPSGGCIAGPNQVEGSVVHAMKYKTKKGRTSKIG